MVVALKVAAVQSRADQPAAGVPAAEAAAFPADRRAPAAPEAAVAQFRADRPALGDPVAEAAAFPAGRPAAVAPAAVEVVCPAWVASRFLDPRSSTGVRATSGGIRTRSRYASSAHVP